MEVYVQILSTNYGLVGVIVEADENDIHMDPAEFAERILKPAASSLLSRARHEAKANDGEADAAGDAA